MGHDNCHHGKIFIKFQEAAFPCWWQPTAVWLNLRPIQPAGNHTLYWNSRWLLWASKVTDHRKASTTTTLPELDNSYGILNLFLKLTYKCSYSPPSANPLFTANGSNHRKHKRTQCRDKGYWGAQPKQMDLYHCFCIYGSGNITEEGSGNILIAKVSGSLWSSLS